LLGRGVNELDGAVGLEDEQADADVLDDRLQILGVFLFLRAGFAQGGRHVGQDGPERKGKVCDMLDRFGMVGKKDLFPSQLSGGQQQRVAVARALITEPKLILADEPTGNLSSKEGLAIMEMFKELNAAGTTIIQVTHSEKNAAYGRRLIRLLDGWVEK
jgi:ABC-type lipoprotein export system ATPase subunit